MKKVLCSIVIDIPIGLGKSEIGSVAFEVLEEGFKGVDWWTEFKMGLFWSKLAISLSCAKSLTLKDALCSALDVFVLNNENGEGWWCSLLVWVFSSCGDLRMDANKVIFGWVFLGRGGGFAIISFASIDKPAWISVWSFVSFEMVDVECCLSIRWLDDCFSGTDNSEKVFHHW